MRNFLKNFKKPFMESSSSSIQANFTTMKHVYCKGFGDPTVLNFKESEIPKPKLGEVLLRIKGSALNRADTLQRKGAYPPPKGVTDIIGLEASGYLAKDNGEYEEKNPMMALLPGGGYAQYCTVNKDHIMPVPKGLSIHDAAGIPEAWLTAYLLLRLANIKENDNVLIYAGASGVGTAAIQMIKHFKAKSIVTCSTEDKCQYTLNLGANNAINYKSNPEWEKEVLNITNKKGVDVLLDCVGASFFDQSLASMALDGRWILYGLMGGAKLSSVNLSHFTAKRISFISTTLRTRSDEFKTDLVNNFKEKILPGFETGIFKPIIETKIPIDWKDPTTIQNAHKQMEENKNIGKIILCFEQKQGEKAQYQSSY